ncbi:MAG: hypothetical protein H0U49_12550 [Parachlamydiaceae bacterium]|nr:hypothetical protein [Parachlamydiaceae bacterium]
MTPKFKIHILRGLLASFLSLSFMPVCYGEVITWRSPNGELSSMHVYPSDSFMNVIALIREQFDDALALNQNESGQSEFLIDFAVDSIPSTSTKIIAKDVSSTRIYTPLTKSEQKDIAYIVTTLGNASLSSIAGAKSSLKKAGDRIETVHPMQFLLYVFTDEKLKAAMHNLQDRTSWIRNGFFDGIFRSFDEEASRNNLNSHIEDFATRLNLEYAVLYPLVNEKRWKVFFNTLYTQIPRLGDPDRYNM